MKNFEELAQDVFRIIKHTENKQTEFHITLKSDNILQLCFYSNFFKTLGALDTMTVMSTVGTSELPLNVSLLNSLKLVVDTLNNKLAEGYLPHYFHEEIKFISQSFTELINENLNETVRT